MRLKLLQRKKFKFGNPYFVSVQFPNKLEDVHFHETRKEAVQHADMLESNEKYNQAEIRIGRMFK